METLGAIIVWAVFGLVVGLLARLIVPGRQTMGMFATVFLGILGSLAGGFVSWIFTGGPQEPYHPAGWIMSILGAVIIVWATSARRRRIQP